MRDPVSYPVSTDLRTDMEVLRRSLAPEHAEAFKHFRDYIFGKAESWVLDASVVNIVGVVLTCPRPTDKVKLLKLFAHCAKIKEDFEVLLTNDRKDKFVLNYMARYQLLGREEQKSVAHFLCNLSSRTRGRNWCLYFSNWTVGSDGSGDIETCNGEVCSNVAVQAMGAKQTEETRKYGLGLAYNLSLRKANVHSEGVKDTIIGAHQSLVLGLREALATLETDQKALCSEAVSNLDLISSLSN